MSSRIRISIATVADLESLTDVCRNKPEDELDSVCYDRNKTSKQLKVEMSRLALSNNLEDFKTRVFKTALQNTGEIVGFSVLEYKGAVKENSVPPTFTPAGVNGDLAAMYWDAVTGKEEQHLAGQRHVVWGSLQVSREYQNKGIEAEMLRWGFTHFGLEKETLWTTTPTAGVDVFSQYGLTKVDVIDIDLRRWSTVDDEHETWKIWCMLRYPSGLKDSGLERKNIKG